MKNFTARLRDRVHASEWMGSALFTFGCMALGLTLPAILLLSVWFVVVVPVGVYMVYVSEKASARLYCFMCSKNYTGKSFEMCEDCQGKENLILSGRWRNEWPTP